jgi:hypothetical protein
VTYPEGPGPVDYFAVFGILALVVIMLATLIGVLLP